jgi:DNA-3-methyladenine glycosylase
MQRLRQTDRVEQLTSGPGKLCQALAIDFRLNGVDLTGDQLFVVEGERFPDTQVVQTTRIGIRSATDKPWRFYVKGNPFVSVRK